MRAQIGEPLSLDYQAPADLLAERVVLVTGAGGGIGRAVSRGLAAHGATVVLLGRTVRRLEAVYDAIVDAGHPEPAIFPMNLANAALNDYEQLIRSLEAELGRLDGLVHNAAMLGTPSPLDHWPLEEWSQVFQVNVHAPYLLTRICLPLLRRADDGRVLFTGDQVGRRGRAYWGAYAASKAAHERLMEVFADELQSEGRVRLMSLDPGPTRTDLRATAYPAEDPLVRRPPEDLLPAYLRLLGPEGRDLHGRSLTIA